MYIKYKTQCEYATPSYIRNAWRYSHKTNHIYSKPGSHDIDDISRSSFKGQGQAATAEEIL